jgi:hypothetical protein
MHARGGAHRYLEPQRARGAEAEAGAAAVEQGAARREPRARPHYQNAASVAVSPRIA